MEIKLINDNLEVIHPDGNWILKKDIGYSPLETLVIAIGGCSAAVYRQVLTNSHIEYHIETVQLAYTRQEDGKARPLASVTVTFYLKNVSPDQQAKATRAIRLIERNCPVVQSLDPKIQVNEVVVFV
ncbi:OsmC family protein [Enterococcus sp. HY326]|uniref:OsmC family protein n=1 Tax=Enterococcus sp. HY326 TaxID=2971265 RepID=UPI0022403C34|nr:OsmC family protein [Enterococcus sp. HY326]